MTNQSLELITTQVTDLFDLEKGRRGKRDKKYNDVDDTLSTPHTIDVELEEFGSDESTHDQTSLSSMCFQKLDHTIANKYNSHVADEEDAASDTVAPHHALLDHRRRLQDSDSINILSLYMASAGERITWVESREIWSGMIKMNDGNQSCLPSTWQELKDKHMFLDEKSDTLCHDNTAIARGIKEAYSIRLSNDHSELKFVSMSLAFLWLVVSSLAIVGYTSKNAEIGTFSVAMFIEAVVLFVAELIWESVLSWVVLRFNVKINYTRKLGNLFKVPKYFAADFLPFYESTALSMFTSLAINQTLFCLIFYRTARERVPYFSYVFLSQDRREDRPDTLLFQVTEDIMRFSIYFPFKIFVANAINSPAIIFIPILINNIGDGLAEPIGVRFGKHKYTTTALYYKGKFWNGEFTRSYEGSSCVFITTVIVVAMNHAAFTKLQFWLTMTILPFLMTIGEARAPHTNDGPFLALIGCGFLSVMFFCVP